MRDPDDFDAFYAAGGLGVTDAIPYGGPPS